MPFQCESCQRHLSDSDDAADLPLFCTFCGYRLRNPAPVDKIAKVENCLLLAEAKPPTTPRFEMLRHIGSGGMGEVYEAMDGVLGERVAVKFLSESLATNPAIVARFLDVGRLAMSFRHPHCVEVICVDDDDDGQPFIAMELMPGRTLKDVVDERGQLTPERAISYILDVIEGLCEAHRMDIIHRDMKPSNCLLTEDDRVKVGDFGLARVGNADQPSSGVGFSGTVLFASPEQIRGEEVGFDSDIYSVCATLYYLLCGRAPHQAESITATLAKAISQDPPPLRRTNAEISATLERIVLKGLERDRSRRWSSLDELRMALRTEVVRKGLFARLWALLCRR